MIRLESIQVTLPGFTLESIDLRVAAGEFFVLIGPTGAGKSLLLEAIVGVVPVTRGRIVVDGRDITRLPPERRRIGIVYQDQALFPHLTVAKNITYGLRYGCRNSRDRSRRVPALVKRLALTHLMGRAVTHLSGGERQRVALARALAVDPAVLLLDEPLSALDPNFREEIREVLRDLHRHTGVTILMVTHDFAETHCLAQRVALIHKGRIEQYGTLEDVFGRPATPFAAEFVGMRNFLPAAFNGLSAHLDGLTLRLARPAPAGARFVGIRPEDLRILAGPPPPGAIKGNCFEATVDRIVPRGFTCDVGLAAGGVGLVAMLPGSDLLNGRVATGERVAVAVDAAKIHAV
jgi:molybdate/tungstate transport system ATP-binding protein